MTCALVCAGAAKKRTQKLEDALADAKGDLHAANARAAEAKATTTRQGLFCAVLHLSI